MHCVKIEAGRQESSELPAPGDGPAWGLQPVLPCVFLDPCFCVADLVQEALRALLAHALAWIPPLRGGLHPPTFAQQWRGISEHHEIAGHSPRPWLVPLLPPKFWHAQDLAFRAGSMPCGSDIQPGARTTWTKPPVPQIFPTCWASLDEEASLLHGGTSWAMGRWTSPQGSPRMGHCRVPLAVGGSGPSDVLG